MKVMASTVLGYARSHGALPAPSVADVLGTSKEITAFIEVQDDGLFYNESLFVGSKRVLYPRIPQVLWELEHDGSSTVRLDGEEVNMEAIYTDRSQCERFDAPYFGAGEMVVAADTLLRSKGGDGYDPEHTEYLSRLGGVTLVLTRKDGDRIGPGWWRVEVLRGPRQ